jgi:hypothetical protein
VSTNSADIGPGGVITGTAFCPAGTSPLGGGFGISSLGSNPNNGNTINNIHIAQSFPNGTTWQATVVNTNTAAITGTWYAVCARTS